MLDSLVKRQMCFFVSSAYAYPLSRQYLNISTIRENKKNTRDRIIEIHLPLYKPVSKFQAVLPSSIPAACIFNCSSLINICCANERSLIVRNAFGLFGVRKNSSCKSAAFCSYLSVPFNIKIFSDVSEVFSACCIRWNSAPNWFSLEHSLSFPFSHHVEREREEEEKKKGEEKSLASLCRKLKCYRYIWPED